MHPISKAPLIGSNLKFVPGTRTPNGTEVPFTTGPNILVQAGNLRASNPQPRVSIRQFLAVSRAKSEFISKSVT